MITDRQQFLNDILITAVEGGIGYWSAASQYDHGNDERPATVTVHEFDEESGKYAFKGVPVTTSMIGKAVRAILDGKVQVRSDIKVAIFDGNQQEDAGEIDSECADVIVQVAMFGEIVYG